MQLKYMFLLVLVSSFISCTITDRTEIDQPGKQQLVNYETIYFDSLQQEIINRNIIIDTLMIKNEELYYQIDSLQYALEAANSRVAVNKDFVIPDSMIFSERRFDLTNDRIYDKFEKIFQQELRVAHKFIPRSGEYFAYFDSVFTEFGIPLDVKYLAIAESRLNPMAGSSVGALGIWQFMPKTATGYGLRINSFIDERRNVFLATPAAAKYLLNARNYLQKGNTDDWLLTFCSYNAGVGSISKVVREQDAHDFFDLLMRVDETHKYVWRAAAIKMIFENEKEIFGKYFERKAPILQDRQLKLIKLKGHYKIDEWAKAQGTSIGKILELNPWIKIYQRNRIKYSAVNNVVLPPGEYLVLIPDGEDKDLQLLANIENQFMNENDGFITYHIVKSGDNLYNIARKYKTTVNSIKLLNNLRSSTIHPGQKLRLYGDVSSSAIKKTDKYHLVKKGETVGSISLELGVSQTTLIKNNNLNVRNGIIMIYPGQKLYY
ncbi:MAG: LysM peptidoglycan-binding domain-containing protein [Candidatus Cloacimonetes bacterium]|nr:LysM peptidoglycan-binding domain-containing protein [Candidatus Cloacimonadota bacterium]